MEIIVASNNQGKIQELQSVSPAVHVVSYRKYTEQIEVSETGKSYTENAWLKASQVGQTLNLAVLGDDGGLELAAFPDKLGLQTARQLAMYQTDAQKNQAILKMLVGKTNRSFSLWAALVYYQAAAEPIVSLEKVTGEIANAPKGTQGYGFDSILWIPEKGQTLAEMDDVERLKFSPRVRAFQKLIRRLEDV